MTTKTILTDDDLRDQKINLGVIAPDDFFNRVARAIEQAVLQSEQVQEWKRGADRLDWLAGPTPEMVEATEDAYMTFGDMELAIRMAVLAAPAVQGEPVTFDEDVALTLAEREFYTEIDERLAADIIRYARKLHTLYTAPQSSRRRVACGYYVSTRG